MDVELKGRQVLVLGLGDTGLSMARWLARRGARLRVADTRTEPPGAAALARELPGVTIERGPFQAGLFAGQDLIALSPGIDRREGALADALKRGVPAAGDIELFAQASRGMRSRVIAVTGTNGKSTVTAMAGAMCRDGGLDTVVAGNIGLPVLDALAAVEDGAAEPDVYVLELSSFQLESTVSLAPDAATMLNLSEDHFDRYAAMTDYAAAKARIFAGNGTQVLNRDDHWSRSMAQPGRTVQTFGLSAPAGDSEWGVKTAGGARALAHGARDLLRVDELAVTGLHNAANALAAGALAAAIGVPETAVARALRGFKGLPHRAEKVLEIDGIPFIDDSKGTNVGATVAALSGMTEPVVLIAGGDGKGQDFSPLAAPVARHARAVVLIGRDAELIARALAGCGVPLERARDMDEAVAMAFAASTPGCAVLLSPACASYDMFRSYVHRAEVFVAAVHKLAERRS